MSQVLASENVKDLKSRLDTLEQQSKALSKKIGQAKKAKDPIADQLISEKRALHQSEIDPLKAHIKELSEQTSVSTEKTDATSLSAPPAYPQEQAEPEDNYVFEQRNLSDSSDLKSWNQFVRSHPMGTLYFESSFLSSIHKSLGHRIILFSLKSAQDQRLLAVLPVIEQKSRLFGHLWTSIALVNYGGVLAKSESVEQALLEHVKTEAETSGVKRLEIRGLYQRPIDWPVSTEKASMWLKLPESGGSDTLLKRFKAKLRSQIKKGYTEQVTVKTGGLELLDDYYSVFARNMRDLGTPVYGKNLFSGLLKDLGDQSKLVIVYHEARPASAAFLIQSGKTIEIPWASTIRDFNQFNLNMVLYWEVLKYCCERQCEIFDFGRSSIDASTYKFKKQWGAEPIQHFWYSLEPGVQQVQSSAPQGATAQNPKFQLLIRVWQKLPLWLANLMGPHIVKYIP